jgi:hypothetical protein
MKMNRILSLSLAAMTIAAGAAHAAVQAKFHLPFEARWGQVTLTPGDYQVLLPEPSLGNRQFLVTGDDRSGYIQPIVTDSYESTTRDASRGSLRLVKVNGAYFVSQYRSGASGKTFTFAIPKESRRTKWADRDVVNLNVSGN